MSKKQKYLLFLILIFAFIIRIPQVNFPSIGYHNMKENEYISMAKLMMETHNFINRDVYFYNAFEDKKDFALYPQVPFLAYQILLGYKLFGDNLWFPRLLNIIFMISSIICIFYLTYIFTGSITLSLSSALLLSILPLGVYFSRSLQPESGAFFFLCLGNLLGIKFMHSLRKRHLFGLVVCTVITTSYKLSFLIGFLPLLLIFPYKRYIQEKKTSPFLKEAFIFILPWFLLLSYWIFNKQISFTASWKGRVDLLDIFSFSYWRRYGKIIWHYTKNENFTLIYFLLFVAGLIILWSRLKKDRTLFARYLRGWCITAIPYFMVFSDYLNQHNYYQMPFLGFVCFTIIYSLNMISGYVSSFITSMQKSHLYLVLFGISLLLAFLPLKKAIRGHFQVIFPGTDMLGKRLKNITTPEERFFIYTFTQGYAPCVYAERKCGWVNSLEEFKTNEAKFKIRYLVIYPLYFWERMDKEIKNYINDNYYVKLVGLTKDREGLFPTIILLEKGGKFDIQGFLQKNKDNLKLETTYNTISGTLPFYTIE